MNPLFQQLLNFPARRLTDAFNHCAALAQNNYLLAVTLDINRDFGPNRTVFSPLPQLGFNRQRIREFLPQKQKQLFADNFRSQKVSAACPKSDLRDNTTD